MRVGPPGLTLRERVLIWLDHLETRGGADGVASTQTGIAGATGISRAHVSRTVAPLVEGGLLAEEDRRLPGFARVVKGYRLAAAGRGEDGALRETVFDAPVEIPRPGERPSRGSVRQVEARAPESRARCGRSSRRSTRETRSRSRHRRASARPARDGSWTWPTRPPPARSSAACARSRPSGRGSTAPRSARSSWRRPAASGSRPSSRMRSARRPRARTWRGCACTTGSPRMTSRRRWSASRPRSAAPTASRPRATPTGHLAELRARVRGFPLVVVADDVQKAGPSARHGLAMIGRLAEVERGVRIVLLGREVEVPGEAFREARFLRLGPLPATEAEALLESREVPAGNPAVLARAAGGNPLFLELLASAPDPVAAPGDLAAFVARVLAPSLAPAERETLRWASALRAPFDSGLIARLGIGSRAALDHLARASLLERRDDGRYGMHDVVRDAVYPTIDSAELRSMHERVAEAYRPRAGTGGDVAEFLHHLVAADRRDDALRWVLRNQSRLLARAREVFRAGGGRA